VVHSYTIMHHPPVPGYGFPIPIGLIDLEEGTRIVSNVVDCKPEDVEVGMQVRGFIHTDDDGFMLPLFRPAT
jgi:uncharacterized OB-fold protein